MGTRDRDELEDVMLAIAREHGALVRSIDTLEASCTGLRLGLVQKYELEGAIYDLFVKLDDHLVEEERLLRPIAGRVLDRDDVARLELMFHEHEEQRTFLLGALDRTEEGLLGEEELLALAARLVASLRADIALEEELLSELTRGRRDNGAHPSR